LFIQTHVAPQRKGVKPNEFAAAIELLGKCPQILNKWPPAGGAPGAQKLYMTCRMQISKRARGDPQALD
jgi:hypothetical protein